MAVPKAAASTSVMGVTALRPPTIEQRAKVRDLIAKYFDEEAGMYMEGYTDQRIAEEAGELPWAIVAQMREVAFGPIRTTPEMAEIRAQIDKMRQNVTNLESEARALMTQVANDVSDAKAQLTEMENRLVKQMGKAS